MRGCSSPELLAEMPYAAARALPPGINKAKEAIALAIIANDAIASTNTNILARPADVRRCWGSISV